MKTIDRYIGRTVAAHFAFALGILLAVFSVINLGEELAETGTGRYGTREAIWFMLAMLPSEAYEILPAAALIGSVAGLGMLASRNELIALLASGVSPQRLSWATSRTALGLMLVTALLGELVAAPLAQQARQNRSVAMSDGSALSTRDGVWTRDRARFVNVRLALPDGQLRDLYVFEFDESHRLRAYTHAETASYANEHWTLRNLTESRLSDDAVDTSHAPIKIWDRFLEPTELDNLAVPPEELSVADLLEATTALAARGEDPAQHKVALWHRVSQPIVTAIMLLLGMPFVFAVKGRTGAGVPIVAGILAGIGFQMLSVTFARFGLAAGLPAPLSAFGPALGVGLGFLAWLTFSAQHSDTVQRSDPK